MTPRKGDKVRVTFEAEYDSDYNGSAPRYGHLVTVAGHRAGSTLDRFTCAVPNDASIEVIEDLRPGDVYRTGEGWTVVVLHLGSEGIYGIHPDAPRSWWKPENLPRPLTLLVRDGQPVAS